MAVVSALIAECGEGSALAADLFLRISIIAEIFNCAYNIRSTRQLKMEGHSQIYATVFIKNTAIFFSEKE